MRAILLFVIFVVIVGTNGIKAQGPPAGMPTCVQANCRDKCKASVDCAQQGCPKCAALPEETIMPKVMKCVKTEIRNGDCVRNEDCQPIPACDACIRDCIPENARDNFKKRICARDCFRAPLDDGETRPSMAYCKLRCNTPQN